MNRHFGFGKMKSYDEWLVEKLSDPKRALSYLKSEYEEFEIDGDVEALKNALSIYLRSQQHVLHSSVHAGTCIHDFAHFQSLAARSHLILALYQAGCGSLASRVYTSQRTIEKEGFDNQDQFDDPIEVDVSFGQVAPI